MTLTPSHRVSLLTEIANRLSAEEWSLIDMTLKQFSLPIADQWPSGDKRDYVLTMLEEATDQALIDLAQHVGFKFEAVTTPRLDPPFWRQGMLRVFITHLSDHRALAAELQEELMSYGISCFVAHNDIEPTKEWQTEIETALATCDALIALLHQGFHASNWTDQEIGFVMGRGVPAFTIRFDLDPYGFLGRFQAFNGVGKSNKILASEIFEAFLRNKETQHRMGDILVNLFHESRSFAEAKKLISYLEQIEVWESSFSTRILSAKKTNSQVSGSFGVPARVEALIKKWA